VGPRTSLNKVERRRISPPAKTQTQTPWPSGPQPVAIPTALSRSYLGTNARLVLAKSSSYKRDHEAARAYSDNISQYIRRQNIFNFLKYVNSYITGRSHMSICLPAHPDVPSLNFYQT
jgi:hypothetical protein